MTLLRVLFIITLSEMGGAQKVVYNLAAGLNPQEFDITVACAQGGELVDWLKSLEQRVKVIEISSLRREISPWHDLKAFWKLYWLIKKNKFDIVHCHSSKAGILGRLAAWLAGVPKIFFTAHGWVLNEYQHWSGRLCYTWIERLAGTVSTKVVCVSEYDLLKARNLKIAADDKLVVFYNGLPEPETQEGLLRNELGIKKNDLVIGTVARLAPQKDPLFLLKVAEGMICRQNCTGAGRLYFVLIGDGPLRPECENFINSKGLSGRVFLLGTREEAAKLVQDFDIFVLFSRWEGLPLTIIEAMMASRPVVASAVGGVGELVVPGETGLLIEQLDVNEAEKALLHLIYDPGKRLAMGQAGRKRACRLFNINQMVDQYRELYLAKF